MTTLNEFVQVDFKYKNNSTSLKLYSKFTRISGDSGDGKSKFVSEVKKLKRMHNPDFSYTISNNFKLHCLTTEDAPEDYLTVTNAIILLDDVARNNAESVNNLLKTNNLFIFVCRSTSMCGAVPLIGNYIISETNAWFNITNVQLPIYTTNTPIDKIIVESSKDRSEHALLSVYRDDIIPARGQSKIHKYLKRCSGTKLVLADLGNIGDILPKLLDYTDNNKDVYFYDYQAFEELLYKSPLLQHLVRDTAYSVFTDVSLEKYYEHVLAECTRGTEFEYTHDHPVLADPYLDKDNFNKIFDSDVGRALIPLLSDATEDFDAVAYLQNKAGDKFKYFTQIQIDNCQTQEDCDQLLQSLRWLD